MRILITGGAGFIGVNAARHFVAQGHEVTILDNFSRKGSDHNRDTLIAELPQVQVVEADVRTDVAILEREAARHDGILHLAAQVAVTTSIVNPREDFEQNLLGTFNVLEAARTASPQPSVVYASTNKVYGGLEHHTVHEEGDRYVFDTTDIAFHGIGEAEPLDFHSPYGCSKGGADAYAVDYHRIYGLKTVVFRQSCVYGKHQFGIEDQGWVAWFTIAAMQNRPLTIYGNGKQVRDALYADDLADLYLRAFTNMDRVAGRAYNVGGGPKNTLSLIELLARLKGDYGYAPELSYAAIRAGDQPIFVADIRKAKADLGWEPKVGLEEGIEKMHAWIAENRDVIERSLAA